MANEIVQDLQVEAVGSFKLCYRESPMARPVIKDLPLGITVADIRARTPKLTDIETLISSGAEVLDDSYVPQDGDVIDVTLVPADPGTIALTLAIISLLAAGYALYQAKGLKSDNTDTKEERIRGIRNRERVYEPLPVVLGKRKVAPCFYARPWTEFVGQDEYFNIMLSAGYGPLKLENFRIGEASLAEFEHDIRILDYYGYNDIEAVRELWQSDIVQDNVEVEIEEAAGWTVRNTAASPDFISCDYSWPVGVYRTNDSGKPRERFACVEVQYQQSNGDWISVAQLQPANSSVPVSVRLVGGQYLVRVGESGSTADITAFFSHTDGNLVFFRNLPDNRPVASVWYNNNVAKAARKGIKFEPLNTSGNVVVRSRKVWPPVADDNPKAVDTTFWATLRTHRNLSETGFKSIIGYDRPPVVVNGVKYTNFKPTIIVLRIKATNQLNGMLDNLYCDATMVVPADPQADWRLWSTLPPSQLKPSENPADAYRWLLQGPMNANPVANSRLDIDEFERWFDKNEDEGWTISNIIDYPSTLLRELNNIAFTGRAEYGFVDGQHSVVIKEAKTIPVQVFTPKNTNNFVASRNFPEDVDGIKVTFNSALADYERDEVVFIDPVKREGTGNPALQTGKFQAIDLWGVTDPDLAYRHARFAYYEQALRREVYTFSVDFEALRCTRGDLVYVQNDIINVGAGAGRIKSLTASTVTLDEIVDVENLVGATGLQFRLRTGAVVTLSATYLGDGTWSVVTPSEAAVGDLVVYGEAGKETIQCIITEMEFTENLSANITAVNAANEMFSFDGDPIPEYQAGTTTLPDFVAPQAPFITAVAIDPRSGRITATLEIDPNSRVNGFVHLLQYRSIDLEGVVSDWENGAIASEGSISFNLDLTRGFTYEFRARSRGGNNLYSRWSNIVSSTVSEGLQIDAPSDVVFQHTQEGTFISWRSSDFVIRSFTEIHKLIEAPTGPFNVELGNLAATTLQGQVTNQSYNIGYINRNAWLGAETPSVKHVFGVFDRTIDGVYSTVSKVVVTAPANPVIATFDGQTLNGLMRMQFSAISVYPIAYYELRSTLDGNLGGDLANLIGRFEEGNASFTEAVDGEYRYFVKAVDVAGNESAYTSIDRIYESLDVDLEAILPEIISEVEAELEQLVNDQLADYATRNEVNNLIDSALEEVASALDEDPRIGIIETINNVFDNAETNKKFDAEIAELNDEVLPALQTDLQELEGKFPITATDISDNAITTPKILAGAITTEKMIVGSISGDRIAVNTLNADRIVANSITADKIGANQITAGKIAVDAVNAAAIQAGAIVADKIAANAVVSDKINAGAVVADKIAAGAILAEKIAAGAVTAGKLAANSVEAANIQAGAITAVKLSATAIDGQLITGALFRTAANTGSNARVVIGGFPESGGESLPFWYGTGNVSTANASFYVNSLGTVFANNIVIQGTSVFQGNLTSTATITGGTVRTASSGYRTEMSSSGSFPLWYGTGVKDSTNGLFFVDTSGNVTMRNATIQGFLRTSSTTGQRVEVGDDGTYLIWAGNGAKTDANGTFWIKTNGTGFVKGEFFQGQIIESKLNTATASFLPVTASVSHLSAGKNVRVTGTGVFRLTMQGKKSWW